MNPSLILTNRTYRTWSLRGWLLCRFAGLDITTGIDRPDPDTTRSAPAWQVPRMLDEIEVWGPLAIAEYLHEHHPHAGILPQHQGARVRCRAVCGQALTQFNDLRAAFPLNLRKPAPRRPYPSAVHHDLRHLSQLWDECLNRSGGPYLFGSRPGAADALYAPDCLRLHTYNLDPGPYCHTITALPALQEWTTTQAIIETIDDYDHPQSTPDIPQGPDR